MSIYSWIKGRLRPMQRSAAGTCLVCQSAELEPLATNAYRCLGCGYEGGEGYATYLENQRAARIEALDPPARLAFARQRLDAARNLANGANLDPSARDSAASLANAAADVVLDTALSLARQHGVDRQAEEDQELVELAGQLLEAQRELDDVCIALAEGCTIVPIGDRIIRPGVPKAHARVNQAAQDLLRELDRLELVYKAQARG